MLEKLQNHPHRDKILRSYQRWLDNRDRWVAEYRAAKQRVLEQLTRQREQDEQERGFPPGGELKLYALWWVSGLHENGEAYWSHQWLVRPTPDSEGWFEALQYDKTRRIWVQFPHGFYIEEHICRSIEDVPHEFRVCRCYEKEVPPTANLTAEELSHLGILNIDFSDEEREAVFGGWVRLPVLWVLSPLLVQLLKTQKEGHNAEGS